MTDHLTGLRLFVRVVERASFTAVAKELGMSQPSVSRQVAALERRLSARLLVRTTRRVKPTEAGLKLYERATRALDELADAEAEVGRSLSSHEGQLRVAASLAFGRRFVIPAARSFLRDFPKVTIDLIINDRYVDLIEEGVDIAIRVGALDDSTYMARSIGREELAIVASPRYLRARGKPRTVEQLAEHDGIVLVRRGVPMRWTLRTPDGERAVTLTGPLRLDNIVAVHAAACEGMGIAVLPSYLVEDDLRSRVLVPVLPDVEAVGLPVSAVYPPTRRLSAKAQSFIDHLDAIIRAA